MVDNQIRRIALDAIPGADLDRSAGRCAEQGEEIQEDSILSVLRVAAEFYIGEVRQP